MAHNSSLLAPDDIIFSTTLLATDFTGQVVSVLDGDTIEALHNGESERLRLNGESNGMGV